MSEELLALYDAQMRADPPRAVGVRHERVGSVVRSSGSWNVVRWWSLSADDAAAAVAEQAAFARANRAQLEWKLYDHDGPAGLPSVLAAAGFVADEPETFMVRDLQRPADDECVLDGVVVRRVVDATGVADYLAVSGAAFGEDNDRKAAAYVGALGDPALALFVAYAHGGPVCAGRLQMPEGRAFASMWGGGTVPSHRGRGIYRALVAERAAEARRRGYRYLTVDARASSRPILERLGFVALTGVTGWMFRGDE